MTTDSTARDGLPELPEPYDVLGDSLGEPVPMFTDNQMRAYASAAIAALAPAEAECAHDWARGYGVPPYCNLCGQQEARVVDEVRAIAAEMCADARLENGRLAHDAATGGQLEAWADRLTAALTRSSRHDD